jgi:hypothetical protein
MYVSELLQFDTGYAYDEIAMLVIESTLFAQALQPVAFQPYS